MTTCVKVREQIILYVDDELPDPDRAAFEAHIAICTFCRRALVEAWAFIQKLRAARPLYRVPAELQERIERIIADRGLTYALASDFEGRGQQSCLICHQGVESNRLIEPLNYKKWR